MTGLFSRSPKDPQLQKNIQTLKEVKKLVRKKRYPEALKLGTAYLQKVPNNHDVLFTVGGIYYMKNQYRTAISYFDKALAIGSYDIDVLLLKAYSHQKLSENNKAVKCCKKIQEIDPKNKAVLALLAELDP